MERKNQDQVKVKSSAARHDAPPVLSQLFFQVLSPEAQVCSRCLAVTGMGSPQNIPSADASGLPLTCVPGCKSRELSHQPRDVESDTLRIDVLPAVVGGSADVRY